VICARIVKLTCLFNLTFILLAPTFDAAAVAAEAAGELGASSVPSGGGDGTTLLAAVQPPAETEENSFYIKAMTPSALEIAEITSIKPILSRLKREQDRARALAAQSGYIDNLDQSLKLQQVLNLHRMLYYRSKANAYIQTAHLELDSVLGKINSGLADLADRKAMIADQRARTLRRTTFINLISGGLTKIGGYSVALTPASAIPTNVLEVFDGVVQVGLSALTLRQQKAEARLGKARPEILDAFLSGNNFTSHFFPGDVWTFLNRVPPQSKEGKTRRQMLIDSWTKMGRLSDQSASGLSKKIGSFAVSNEFHLDDLDDTVAMTSDLKSVIATMDTSLMELAQVCRDSYKEDPDI
jgi:hypothetical protein